jgi:A/G-specific adenine glycosylase
MLQQTQVERVVPRYLDWLARWPTVESLAAVPLADVIRAWQGLGYNRRAVNLHRAASVIAADGWPDDLTKLPGVGRYTADALGRFAFGASVLPVDTNVRRVLERMQATFSSAAAHALMDLGATDVPYERNARRDTSATRRSASRAASKAPSASGEGGRYAS